MLAAMNVSEAKRKLAHVVRNAIGGVTPVLSYASTTDAIAPQRVLVLGVYLSDHPNTAAHLVQEFGRGRRHRITQDWARLGQSPTAADVAAVTRWSSDRMIPKFTALNRLLAAHDLNAYDHILISDDDVRVRRGFIDTYLHFQVRCDLALSQPARTAVSYVSYQESRRVRGAQVRETDFVEIGPLFCISRAAFEHVVPFDESSDMGYGYDLVWPRQMQAAGLRMGTIDACPIDHSIRRIGETYSQAAHMERMQAYLRKYPHMTLDDALKRNVIIL
jgi:hypothetical protein